MNEKTEKQLHVIHVDDYKLYAESFKDLMLSNYPGSTIKNFADIVLLLFETSYHQIWNSENLALGT